jgi:hypothetical protein
MKYYLIKVQSHNDNNRISSDVEGKKNPNAKFFFNKISQGEILLKTPVFDYFFLESFDEKQYWEYKVNDVHKFIGEGSQIRGWLVSEKLKLLLEYFDLPKPYHFYPSKLLYKGKKIDYYIFQYTGILTFAQLLLYIDYSKTIFWDPLKKTDVILHKEEYFLPTYRRIYKENKGFDNVMQNKKLVLKEKLDFFPMQMFLKDNIVSQRLKKAIEENNIEGFEFSELNYEVIVKD